MHKGRTEAFSDGVLAIIITIMVLELKVPEGEEFSALLSLLPKFISYVLSFLYVGIYWNNHHHLFQAITKVNGRVLWANLFLLFCLSLLPFTTGWMGENHFAKNPVALYGINLFLCGWAFTFIEKAAIKHEGKDSKLAQAIRNHSKEHISMILYLVGTVLSFFIPIISLCIFGAVTLIWLIPDTRIEKILN